ncbi:MAG TPA: hypothetical protein VJ436_01560 [Anaerolineales bacterium]|nr:hypothetical protein [Anaerolineales bacterium]
MDYNTAMPSRREALFFGLVSLGVLILVGLPYAWAAAQGGQDYRFGGFLLNPVDGNSYLSKMYQGWAGSWKFRLPYTAESEGTSYLFIYYLFLGHAARLLGLPSILVFHAARLLGSLGMLAALCYFFSAVFPPPGPQRLAFSLAAIGSGMGWLLVPFGVFSADFWVAEAYPFLSAYANPHFPLGLALALVLLAPGPEGGTTHRGLVDRELLLGVLAGLGLSLVLPFGVAMVALVLGGNVLVETWEQNLSRQPLAPGASAADSEPKPVLLGRLALRRSWVLSRLAGVLLGGLPLLGYDLLVITRDPLLSGWNAQNLTPSPPPWDLLLSLSPVILLAIPGLRFAWKRGGPGGRLLALWAVLGLTLVYLPFGLQRRFVLGLYIPLAGLAAMGARRLVAEKKRRGAWLVAALFLLALPTNLVVLGAGLHGVQTRDPALYLSRDEQALMAWLAENTPIEAVLLAAPETGLIIPAHSGRRVLYGHPFESVPADVRRAQVTDFYTGMGGSQVVDVLAQVDYVVYGPRERALGRPVVLSSMERVYASGGVEVYQTGRGSGP